MCAAFHPVDEKMIYFFGGVSVDESGVTSDPSDAVFSLNTETGEYEDLLSMPTKFRGHSCVGFVKKNGSPVCFKSLFLVFLQLS